MLFKKKPGCTCLPLHHQRNVLAEASLSILPKLMVPTCMLFGTNGARKLGVDENRVSALSFEGVRQHHVQHGGSAGIVLASCGAQL
jgi:hypothetical protein